MPDDLLKRWEKLQVAEKQSNIVVDIFANRSKVTSVVSKKTMTRDEVVELMRKRQNGRTGKDFAAELGIHPSYLCDIYSGNREPGDRVLTALGLSKLTLYEKAS